MGACAVKRARDELQDIYFENSRYRAEVQKLTQALDKMNEESTMEREEWKAKAVQLLQKLQEEGNDLQVCGPRGTTNLSGRAEDNARRSRAEAEKLANDCIKLGSENLKLDQSLARQEEQIRVVLKELDDTNLKVKELTVENERLRAAAEDSRTTATNATGELTKSQEQLKLMSERVRTRETGRPAGPRSHSFAGVPPDQAIGGDGQGEGPGPGGPARRRQEGRHAGDARGQPSEGTTRLASVARASSPLTATFVTGP